MTFSKIATLLCGLMLLLPLFATFWAMAFRVHATPADVQKTVDAALEPLRGELEASIEPGFPGAAAVRVVAMQQIHLPGIPHRLWSPFPRRWVGITGLMAVLLIALLWVLSSLSPVTTFSAEYGVGGSEMTDPPPSEDVDVPADRDSTNNWILEGKRNDAGS